MTRRHDHQQNLNRGRKAGLSAQEINSALGSQPGGGEPSDQPDCNGFIWYIDERGHRVCKPADEETAT